MKKLIKRTFLFICIYVSIGLLFSIPQWGYGVNSDLWHNVVRSILYWPIYVVIYIGTFLGFLRPIQF